MQQPINLLQLLAVAKTTLELFETKRPRSTDPYSVSNPQQDNAIRENKTLQRKLERSEKACEGLQQGYDDMKDTQKMPN